MLLLLTNSSTIREIWHLKFHQTTLETQPSNIYPNDIFRANNLSKALARLSFSYIIHLNWPFMSVVMEMVFSFSFLTTANKGEFNTCHLLLYLFLRLYSFQTFTLYLFISVWISCATLEYALGIRNIHVWSPSKVGTGALISVSIHWFIQKCVLDILGLYF